MAKSIEKETVQGTLPLNDVRPDSDRLDPDTLDGVKRTIAANRKWRGPEGDTSEHELSSGEYKFSIGNSIWPVGRTNGIVRTDFTADKLDDQKINGLTGFVSKTPTSIFRDGKTTSIPTGTKFGAFSNQAKPVRK